jgi:HK97 family phage major capsid protein
MEVSTIKGLEEKRAGLIHQAKAIFDEVHKRDGKWGGEDSAKYDAIHADIESIAQSIERAKSLDALTREQAAREDELRETAPKGELSAEERSLGFAAWCRGQKNASAKDRELATRAGYNLASDETTFCMPETRAMGVGAASAGDTTFSTRFVRELEVARLAFGNVRNEATVVRTSTGNPMRFPTANDTAQTGALLAENTQIALQDISISEVTLDAYKYSSKGVLVSVELLQDNEVDLESFIGRALGERLGRITNAQFTTGTGTAQPNGIVTASTAGPTSATATTITYANLVDLQHSVDPEYQAGAKWMFNFSTLALLKKLVDGDSRPLWQPAMGASMGSENMATILGKPYVINQQMANAASTLKAVLYGDFSKYLVREVKDITLLRLVERYADYHQVGFLAFMRTDGDLLNAGTNPVKHLLQAT